jgi:hypothetical protein
MTPHDYGRYSTRPMDQHACNITSWSGDGYGHQLSAALSCEALALIAPSRYEYVRSRHTLIEHNPPDADELLDFLNTDGGLSPSAPSADVDPHAGYHQSCNAEKKGAWPPCRNGHGRGLRVVCDNCWATASDELNLANQPTVHDELARRVRRRLRHAMRAARAAASTSSHASREHTPSTPLAEVDADPMCAARYHVCAHVRGVNNNASGLNAGVTVSLGEHQSVRRRLHPPSWWRRALRLAVSEATPPTLSPSVLVHTNDERLATSYFTHSSSGGSTSALLAGSDAGADAWTDARLTVRGPSTPLMRVLADLVFCCDALIIGVSALSSAAALATHARAVYAAGKRNPHFGMAQRVVPCGARKHALRTEDECKPRALNVTAAVDLRGGALGVDRRTAMPPAVSSAASDAVAAAEPFTEPTTAERATGTTNFSAAAAPVAALHARASSPSRANARANEHEHEHVAPSARRYDCKGASSCPAAARSRTPASVTSHIRLPHPSPTSVPVTHTPRHTSHVLK